MPAQIQTIKLWGQGGPNPPKVAIVLHELGLPFEYIPIKFSEVKEAEYTKINPNGRIPAIHDPNTDLTLWESGAIIEYLVERYDAGGKLGFPAGSNEAQVARQWLFFQMSGQGPYFGQAVWFLKYHPEKVQSAVDRYAKEVNRVSGVLDAHLAKQDAGADGPWLVGGRFSYADLSFVTWHTIIGKILPTDAYDESAYPHLAAWLGKIRERTSYKTAMAAASEQS